MKKSRKYFLFAMVIVVCIISISLILRVRVTFPDTVPSENGTAGTSCSEQGMYYIKDNHLQFLDVNSGANVIVCNQANCKHDTENCHAYIEDQGAKILYYDGWVYVSSAFSDIKFEDGETHYTGLTNLDCISSDGSRKKNIYTSNNGAVTSVKAIKDKIYFTAYSFHGEFSENQYVYDQLIYEYDLRWKRLKLVKKYIADENQETSRLQIVKGDATDAFILYEIFNKDGSKKTQLIAINKDFEVLKEYNDDTYYDFVINENKQYQISDLTVNDSETMEFSESTDFFQSQTQILSIEDAWVDIMSNYFLFINSDYNKVLFDCDTGKSYVATTAFEGEKYISDIYDIDKKNNRIYINTTDYTGMLPGTLLYEDTSNQAVVRLDEFVSDNFIDKESLEKDKNEMLKWVKFIND